MTNLNAKRDRIYEMEYLGGRQWNYRQGKQEIDFTGGEFIEVKYQRRVSVKEGAMLEASVCIRIFQHKPLLAAG